MFADRAVAVTPQLNSKSFYDQRPLMFSAVVSFVLTACSVEQTELPVDGQEFSEELIVDPTGAAIEGDTLTFISCLEPGQPERHGVNFIIGGLVAGRNNAGTPQAPMCDRSIDGRYLRVFIRDQDFLKSPLGTWDYTRYEDDGRIYRTDEHWGSVYLHHVDTHYTHTGRFRVPGVSLSVTMTTWDGDDLSHGSWSLQGSDYTDKLGEAIRGEFRIELIDGTVHQGMIEGVWCGGSPDCEKD